MSEDNAEEALKNGLLQYVGALLKMTGKEGSTASHLALAKLSEVWLEQCRTDNGYDMFAAKPILRAASLLLKDYANQLRKDISTVSININNSYIQKTIAGYEQAAAAIDALVSSVPSPNQKG